MFYYKKDKSYEEDEFIIYDEEEALIDNMDDLEEIDDYDNELDNLFGNSYNQNTDDEIDWDGMDKKFNDIKQRITTLFIDDIDDSEMCPFDIKNEYNLFSNYYGDEYIYAGTMEIKINHSI